MTWHGGAQTQEAPAPLPVVDARTAASAPDRRHLGRRDRWLPYVGFVVVAAVVMTISILAHAHLPLLHRRHRILQGLNWRSSFTWWDGWWYVGIARRGYRFFSMDRQSPVAFFPGYPLLLRYVGRVVGDPVLAGIGLTVASGLGATVTFHRWCARKVGIRTAGPAVALLLLFPFAFYLMGPVYSDALFLFMAVGAFLALEADRPALAGVLAAVATATRPVGVAVILGLWILALERKGFLRPPGRNLGEWRIREGRISLRERIARSERITWADGGLLLAPIGLIGFCAFLWIKFGRPLAFLDTAGARGWDQPPGFHTWFKIHWVKAMWNGPWTSGHFGHLVINALAAVIVIALVPAVFRRLGPGYGVYVLVAVVLTAISTKDFVGMGRYSLAAFPCFAVAADLLLRRPALLRATLAISAVGLVMLAQLHARGSIIS